MMNNQTIYLDFYHNNNHYQTEAVPSAPYKNFSRFPAFEIFLNNEYSGIIIKSESSWTTDNRIDKDLLKIIGNKILAFIDRL